MIINQCIENYEDLLNEIQSKYVPLDDDSQNFILNKINQLQFIIANLKKIKQLENYEQLINYETEYIVSEDEPFLKIVNNFYGSWENWESVCIDNGFNDMEQPLGTIIKIRSYN